MLAIPTPRRGYRAALNAREMSTPPPRCSRCPTPRAHALRRTMLHPACSPSSSCAAEISSLYYRMNDVQAGAQTGKASDALALATTATAAMRSTSDALPPVPVYMTKAYAQLGSSRHPLNRRARRRNNRESGEPISIASPRDRIDAPISAKAELISYARFIHTQQALFSSQQHSTFTPNKPASLPCSLFPTSNPTYTKLSPTSSPHPLVRTLT